MGTTTSSYLAGEKSVYSIFLSNDNSLSESNSNETILQLTSLENSEETHTIAISRSDDNTLEITYDERLVNSIPKMDEDTWVILPQLKTPEMNEEEGVEKSNSEENLFEIPIEFTPKVPEPVYYQKQSGFQHSFEIFEEYIEKEKPVQKEEEKNKENGEKEEEEKKKNDGNIEDEDWVLVEEDFEDFKDVLNRIENNSAKKAIVQREEIKSLQDQVSNLMQKMEQVERLNQSLLSSSQTFYSCSDMSVLLNSSASFNPMMSMNNLIINNPVNNIPVNYINNNNTTNQPMNVPINHSNINNNYLNNINNNINNSGVNNNLINNIVNNDWKNNNVNNTQNNNHVIPHININVNENNNNNIINNNNNNHLNNNINSNINNNFPTITIVNAAPPPPPPPLPTQQQLNATKSYKISSTKETPKVKSFDDIKKLLAIEIDKSDISDANKEIARENYLRSFSSESALKFLDFMVSSYGRLIQTLPLQPKTAFKLIKIWEANLFTKIEDQVQRDSIRRRKMTEICMKRSEEEIMEEIKKVKQLIEQQKKEAAEKLRRDGLKKNLMGDLLVSLERIKQRNNEDCNKKNSELETLEEFVVDDTEIQLSS